MSGEEVPFDFPGADQVIVVAALGERLLFCAEAAEKVQFQAYVIREFTESLRDGHRRQAVITLDIEDGGAHQEAANLPPRDFAYVAEDRLVGRDIARAGNLEKVGEFLPEVRLQR